MHLSATAHRHTVIFQARASQHPCTNCIAFGAMKLSTAQTPPQSNKGKWLSMCLPPTCRSVPQCVLADTNGRGLMNGKSSSSRSLLKPPSPKPSEKSGLPSSQKFAAVPAGQRRPVGEVIMQRQTEIWLHGLDACHCHSLGCQVALSDSHNY